MATATSSVQGSSSSNPSLDRGLGTHFGLNKADSKAQLFESLLSLPLFDSSINSQTNSGTSSKDSTDVDAGKSTQEKEPISDLGKDEKKSSNQDDDKDPIGSASVNPLLIPAAPIQSTVEQKPNNIDRPSATRSVVADEVYDPDNTIKQAARPDSTVGATQASDKTKISASAEKVQVGPSDSLRSSQSETTDLDNLSLRDANTRPDFSVDGEPKQALPAESNVKTTEVENNGKQKREALKPASNDDPNQQQALVQTPPAISSESNEERVEPDTASSPKEEYNEDLSSKPTEGRRAERLQETRRGSRFQDDKESESNLGDQSTSLSSENREDFASIVEPIDSSSTSIAGLPTTVSDSTDKFAFTNLDTSIVSSTNFSDATSTLSNSSSSGSSAAAATATSNANTLASSIGSQSTTHSPGLTSTASISGPHATVSTTGGTYSSTSSGGASSSSPASGLSKYQEQRVLQRALKGLEKLQDGSAPIRVRLHPPELGSLQVTVRVDLNQIIAGIEVEHSAAKQVLLDNLPKLQASLKEQGISIADFRVDVVAPGDFSGAQSGSNFNAQQGQSRDGNSTPSSRYAAAASNRIQDSSGQPATVGAAVWSRRDGNLDFNA